MKKVAIFTEGQTEKIFIRELLLRLVDASKLKLQCIDLVANRFNDGGFYHTSPNPEIFILIVNVNNDEGVLTSIKNREAKILENEQFEEIIGIRDMYCQKYRKLSRGTINNELTDKITNQYRNVINDLKNNNRIKFFFAVMEIEAWFLGMYKLFGKIDPILTNDIITKKLGYNLKTIDPQCNFYKPSKEINKILNICNKSYKKKKSEVENITRLIDVEDVNNCKENGRCKRFSDFYREIYTVIDGYMY